MMIQRFSLLTLTILVFSFACSKQGEGQRCSTDNGSNDCDDNLVCVTPRGSNGCTDPATDRTNCLPSLCCPPRPQRSNIEACNQYQYGASDTSTGGGSGISSEETGGSTAGGSDTGTGGSDTGTGGSDTGTGGSDTGGTSSAGTEPDAGA